MIENERSASNLQFNRQERSETESMSTKGNFKNLKFRKYNDELVEIGEEIDNFKDHIIICAQHFFNIILMVTTKISRRVRIFKFITIVS